MGAITSRTAVLVWSSLGRSASPTSINPVATDPSIEATIQPIKLY
jgi:hypothetical protein